jgi:hypothetical protein
MLIAKLLPLLFQLLSLSLCLILPLLENEANSYYKLFLQLIVTCIYIVDFFYLCQEWIFSSGGVVLN